MNNLSVNSLGGDDYFASDDTTVPAALDGGAGNDFFQVGQLFGNARLPSDVLPEDRFDTTLTTHGYLSRGISAPMTVHGGAGNDTFQVYSNKANLSLLGEDGNDTFIFRAFALPSGGHNLNDPVTIDGGTGFDKTLVIGTENDDGFALTDQGIFGAGLHIGYANVESLEVFGLEGNDTFFVLSTHARVTTTLIGGTGSDVADITGDVTLPIIQGLVTTLLPAATHTTDQIRGPIDLRGFNGDHPLPARSPPPSSSPARRTPAPSSARRRRPTTVPASTGSRCSTTGAP